MSPAETLRARNSLIASHARRVQMTKADRLAAALDEFLAVSPEVEAAAVVSADGLPMASALPPHVEEDRLAAMSAALLTLGERAAAGLGKGHLAQVFVEGDTGHVILMSAGPNAVLVGVTDRQAKVGLVLFEMRKTASQVARVMEESPTVEPEQRAEAAPLAEEMAPFGQPAAAEVAPFVQPAPPPEPAVGFATESPSTASVIAEEVPGPADEGAEPAPLRAPEPTPAAETESSVSSWT